MFTFCAPYYTYISDEYAVAKRELGIVEVENELLPVFNSRRDFCICSAEYYGPDQERIKFNFSITLTKDQQKRLGLMLKIFNQALPVYVFMPYFLC